MLFAADLKNFQHFATKPNLNEVTSDPNMKELKFVETRKENLEKLKVKQEMVSTQYWLYNTIHALAELYNDKEVSQVH